MNELIVKSLFNDSIKPSNTGSSFSNRANKTGSVGSSKKDDKNGKSLPLTTSVPFENMHETTRNELLNGDVYWVSRSVDMPLPAGNHHFMAIEVPTETPNTFKVGDKNFVGWSGYSVGGDLKFIDANEADKESLREYFSKDKGKPWFKKYWETEIEKVDMPEGADKQTFNKQLIDHIDNWNRIPSEYATKYSALTTNCIYALYNLMNSSQVKAKEIFQKFTGYNPMKSQLVSPKLFS